MEAGPTKRPKRRKTRILTVTVKETSAALESSVLVIKNNKELGPLTLMSSDGSFQIRIGRVSTETLPKVVEIFESELNHFKETLETEKEALKVDRPVHKIRTFD